MKVAVLFSGGKDSCMASYLAKEAGHELSCLISIVSENKESYMFHTPSIEKTKKQAEVMQIPLIIQKTKGKKEIELKDLKKAIKKAKDEYHIGGIVTGALQSIYQASRIQKICNELDLECFNPLWQKDEFEYPLDESWLGKEINEEFIDKVKKLNQKYQIHPAGEGGEFETFTLNCPLFKKSLNITDKKISGEKNSWRMEIDVE